MCNHKQHHQFYVIYVDCGIKTTNWTMVWINGMNAYVISYLGFDDLIITTRLRRFFVYTEKDLLRFIYFLVHTLSYVAFFFWLNVWCVVYIVIIFQQAKVFRFDLPFNLAVVTYTFCVWLKMVFDSETST